MNRFAPNKYSLNRTQANLQAAERNVPAGGGGGGGGAGGPGSHPHAPSHRQTPPVSGGPIAMQPPSSGAHHHGGASLPHSPGHNNAGGSNLPMQHQQSRHEPHAHGDHQHHHHQPQFAGNQQQQQQPSGPGQGGLSAPAPQNPRDRTFDDAPKGTPGGQPVEGQRRPAPLDAPASPTPEEDTKPTALAGAVTLSSPNPLLASSPLGTSGADGATTGNHPSGAGPASGLISIDSMEADNLSEISDDADEILMREEELGSNQLCDSISTDRSADSQQAELLGHEPELDQSGPAVASSVAGGSTDRASQPNAYGPDGDAGAGAPEAEGGSAAGGTIQPTVAPAGETVTGDGETGAEAYGEADQGLTGKLHANKELKEEMDLDFEEISDGELEAEENRGKVGLGDPLGVDWGSLAQEVLHPLKHPAHRQHTHQFPVAARNRWKAHHILLEIGISVRLAGANYAQRVLNESKERLREELEEFRSVAAAARSELATVARPVKEAQRDPTDTDAAGKPVYDVPDGYDGGDGGRLPNGNGVVKVEQSSVRIKTESPEQAGEPAVAEPTAEAKVEGNGDLQQQQQQQQATAADVASHCSLISSIERDLDEMDRILHPVASMHVALREQARLRRNLILPGEPVAGQLHQCGRALSARKDLQIRRQLCGYPPTTMVTMTACAAGAATGFLHQELLADAAVGGGGGTTRPGLKDDIRQMYHKMVAQQHQLQQTLGISATLPAV